MGGFWDDDAPEYSDEPLPETNYYVVSSRVGDDGARISSGPGLPPRYSNWRSGSRLPIDVPQPLVYEIDADDEGNLRPYFDAIGVPLMSTELVTALRSAGVDNLEVYDAIIRETRTGREHKNYKSVNIIGVVSGADMAKSEHTTSELGTNEPIVDVWFEKLVVDEEKVQGNLFFRLAENVSFVLAHRSVKDAIEAANVPGSAYLIFVHPSEWSG